jgi:ribosomal protein S18 acetylase RimI-like enzyme
VRGADGSIVSLAALLLLEGVGYVDNVATFPSARRRGFASALTRHVARVAFEEGASTTCLLTDPDAPKLVRLYRRLGFREAGRIASTRGPVDR